MLCYFVDVFGILLMYLKLVGFGDICLVVVGDSFEVLV